MATLSKDLEELSTIADGTLVLFADPSSGKLKRSTFGALKTKILSDVPKNVEGQYINPTTFKVAGVAVPLAEHIIYIDITTTPNLQYRYNGTALVAIGGGGSGGATIDDTAPHADKTYSSNKIKAQDDDLAAQISQLQSDQITLKIYKISNYATP